MGKKKKRDIWASALDDPLFYVPFIGPLLHGIRHLDDEDAWEENDDEEESNNGENEDEEWEEEE